jgi:hypothetical protein
MWSEWVRDGQMTPAGHQALAFLFERAGEIKSASENSDAAIVDLASTVANLTRGVVLKTAAPTLLSASTSGFTSDTSLLTATFAPTQDATTVEVYGEIQYQTGTVSGDDDGLSISLNVNGASSGLSAITAPILPDNIGSKAFVFRYAPGSTDAVEYNIRATATDTTVAVKGSWVAFRELAG